MVVQSTTGHATCSGDCARVAARAEETRLSYSASGEGGILGELIRRQCANPDCFNKEFTSAVREHAD